MAAKRTRQSLSLCARCYAKVVREIATLEARRAELGAILKARMLPGVVLNSVRLDRMVSYKVDPDALKAAGKWSLVVKEAVDAEKVSALVKLDPAVLSPGGGVTDVESIRLVVVK
jgi:hypothetical protein